MLSDSLPHKRRLNELEATSHRLRDELDPIIEQHVPKDLHRRCWQLLDEIADVHFTMAEQDHREVYRLLLAIMPDRLNQFRAAFMATLFEGCQWGDAEWQRWEEDFEWPVMGEAKYLRLLESNASAHVLAKGKANAGSEVPRALREKRRRHFRVLESDSADTQA